MVKSCARGLGNGIMCLVFQMRANGSVKERKEGDGGHVNLAKWKWKRGMGLGGISETQLAELDGAMAARDRSGLLNEIQHRGDKQRIIRTA